MTGAVVVLVAGVIGVAVTAFSPAQELEMWAPLIASMAPLMAYMMWPRRDAEIRPSAGVTKKAA